MGIEITHITFKLKNLRSPTRPAGGKRRKEVEKDVATGW